MSRLTNNGTFGTRLSPANLAQPRGGLGCKASNRPAQPAGPPLRRKKASRSPQRRRSCQANRKLRVHRQRLRLKASRKNGLVSAVSARAFKVAALSSLSGFDHHHGTRPQRIRTKSRLPSCSITTSTGSVGQILYRGCRLCGGAVRASL
jgi:hypothetical protein